MVIRLKKVKETVPRFVRRKRRLETVDNTDSNVDPVIPSPEPAVNSPKRVRLPEWRKVKEEPIATNTVKKWTEKTHNEMSDRDWRIACADLQISPVMRIILHWSELGPLGKQIQAKFPHPTPVQSAVPVFVKDGTDFIAIADTGSGKTLAFLAPIASMLKKMELALVLAPTRELVLQIADVAVKICSLRCATLVGGHDIEAQLLAVGKQPQIIVATPGRLLDIIGQDALPQLNNSRFVVFDEADRMLDMGFEPQITEAMQHLPPPTNRQTMMFSATWPENMSQLVVQHLKPTYSTLKIGSSLDKRRIKQSVLLIEAKRKHAKLLEVLKGVSTAIVFVGTKSSAETVAAELESRGVRAKALHGGLAQDARDRALESLRQRSVTCLVATDVAARGVDVPGVELVVQYDLPNNIETYVHRIGRTGRAGSSGRAVSLATNQNKPLFPELRTQLRRAGCAVPEFLNTNEV